jgi:hypothetical protein
VALCAPCGAAARQSQPPATAVFLQPLWDARCSPTLSADSVSSDSYPQSALPSVQSSTFSSLKPELSPKCGPVLTLECPFRKVFLLKFLPYSCERFSHREGRNDTAA